MSPVEIAARLYAWGTETDGRTHRFHGAIACLVVALPVTLVAHTVVFRWVAFAGALTPQTGWLLAGAFGWTAAVGAYGFRELEQGFRSWISGRVESVPVYFEDHDARWDVLAAVIGGAIPGPALAFLPDLVAGLL